MKKSIFSKEAPDAAGPYSHAVQAGSFYYLSGQLGIDPDSGELLDGVEAQARQALQNIKTVLASAGLTMDDVVKAIVFLKSMGDFAAINVIYAEAFGENKPARSCVAVAELPRGGLFEVEVVAYKG
jgi:2-iminobutanoate/2-iminopropanoate deaminase